MVDNGSSDGSADTFRALGSRIQVIETGCNLGFAGGNNAGIRHALDTGADYVLLLNNDTTVATDLVSRLVESAATRPDGGIFGPKIYFHADPKRIWSAGGMWLADRQHFAQRGDGELDHGQYDTISDDDFVVGCAMFIRREVFGRIGLLDEDFFLNYEEIDFCTRARKAGFANIYVPSGHVWHKVSVSFGGEDSPLKAYFTFRNRLLWAHKQLSFKQRLVLHWSIYRRGFVCFLVPVLGAAKHGPRAMLWAWRGTLNSPLNQAWYKGIRDYWRRRFGACPKDIWELQKRWKAMRGTS